MKTSQKILGAAIMLSAACNSTYRTTSYQENDDIYYSGKDVPNQHAYQPEPAPAANPDNYTSAYSTGNNAQNQQPVNSENQAQQTDEKTNITNNYYQGDDYNFNTDDYYDYSYSARMRRFQRVNYGFSYYDPFYTNMYWYDYEPAHWGISIYMGYRWWPSYNYGYGYGYGYGYSNPYNYGGYYSNWGYSYGPNYGSGCAQVFNNGYNNGYYNGYYGAGNSQYYYNSYDATSHYYGPRHSTVTNANRSANAPLAKIYQDAKSYGQYKSGPSKTSTAEPSVTNIRGNVTRREMLSGENISKTGTSGNSKTYNNVNTRPADTYRINYTKPAAEEKKVYNTYQRPSGTKNNPTRIQTNTTRQERQVYTRPQAPQHTKTYSSPSVSSPMKSSYSAPSRSSSGSDQRSSSPDPRKR